MVSWIVHIGHANSKYAKFLQNGSLDVGNNIDKHIMPIKAYMIFRPWPTKYVKKFSTKFVSRSTPFNGEFLLLFYLVVFHASKYTMPNKIVQKIIVPICMVSLYIYIYSLITIPLKKIRNCSFSWQQSIVACRPVAMSCLETRLI
jgi:hypothetical protein